MYKSIGGNKRIGGTFCSKLINEQSQISAYRWDFISFSNKRPVLLFGILEYVKHYTIIKQPTQTTCRDFLQLEQIENSKFWMIFQKPSKYFLLKAALALFLMISNLSKTTTMHYYI